MSYSELTYLTNTLYRFTGVPDYVFSLLSAFTQVFFCSSDWPQIYGDLPAVKTVSVSHYIWFQIYILFIEYLSGSSNREESYIFDQRMVCWKHPLDWAEDIQDSEERAGQTEQQD